MAAMLGGLVALPAASEAAAVIRVMQGGSGNGVSYESQIDFGSALQQAGAKTKRAYRIYNDGTTSLSISSITVAQISGSSFGLEWNASAPPFSVAPGSFRTFTVVLDRSVAGLKKARIRVWHTAGNEPSPFSFVVKGTTDTPTTGPGPRSAGYLASFHRALATLYSWKNDDAQAQIESFYYYYRNSHPYFWMDYSMLVAERTARTSWNDLLCQSSNVIRDQECLQHNHWYFASAFRTLDSYMSGDDRQQMVAKGAKAVLLWNGQAHWWDTGLRWGDMYSLGAQCEAHANVVIGAEPQSYEGYMWKGICRFLRNGNAYNSSDYSVITSNLNQAINLGAPRWFAAFWQAMAGIATVPGGNTNAIPLLTTAINLHPDNAAAYYWRSRANGAADDIPGFCGDAAIYVVKAITDSDYIGWNSQRMAYIALETGCSGS